MTGSQCGAAIKETPQSQNEGPRQRATKADEQKTRYVPRKTPALQRVGVWTIGRYENGDEHNVNPGLMSLRLCSLPTRCCQWRYFIARSVPSVPADHSGTSVDILWNPHVSQITPCYAKYTQTAPSLVSQRGRLRAGGAVAQTLLCSSSKPATSRKDPNKVKLPRALRRTSIARRAPSQS